MKALLLACLCLAVASCRRESPPPAVEAPKLPVYDEAFIHERELEYAALNGRREALIIISGRSHPELGPLEEKMRAVERRIEHARAHWGEPYMHTEAP